MMKTFFINHSERSSVPKRIRESIVNVVIAVVSQQ